MNAFSNIRPLRWLAPLLLLAWPCASRAASSAAESPDFTINTLGAPLVHFAESPLFTIDTRSVDTPPQITQTPTNVTVAVRGQGTFSVTAIGTAPFSYQWRKAGVNVPGQTNATLAFNNVQLSDADSYTVVVGNAAGSVTSAPAILTIVTPPGITTQPASQTISPGSAITFTAVATTGGGTLSYQWRLNDVNIPGATNPSYILPAVQANGSGVYTVVVANLAGSVTSSPAVLSFLSLEVYPGLTIIGPVGTRYRIDYALDANAASWTVLTNMTLPVSPYIFSDYTAPTRTKRFYRAVALP